MNKTAIKNYAIWARVQLIESAKQRAFEYEITENGENKTGLDTVGGRLLTKTEIEQRDQLIDEIKQKGYAQVMEEAAYTWFNRFIALRFMEVNGFLPSKIRVFTDENGEFKPEILRQAMSVEIDGIDRNKVLELLDKQNNEELYKYLLITQCNALSTGLPYIFEKIFDWTELLFPTNLLHQDSVIGGLIADIDVEDWNDEVEIIGWLYQYYIFEKHEEVVDPLHGRVINKEDIPAATQLFTTDWVVRYILDNSLGRYWIERHPESKLAEKLTYFVTPKDGIIPTVNETIRPEELKILDPCVGSGHFLSYAFDILLEIYRECGWSDRDAAKSILENNLYGLDIDDRATQLACFAVMMKARKHNRRIISADTELHIIAIQESTFISDELIKYVSQKDASIKRDLNELRLLFNNAKEYGSIITVPQMDYNSLYARMKEIGTSIVDNLMDVVLQKTTKELLLPLIRQAEILSGKYDVVATNPPYMNKYSARLKAFIGEHFNAYKGDLFSVFMYRNFDFCKANGYSGLMTPNVWMFIKTYELLRKYVIKNKSITTLIQMAKGAFFKEATVDICAFVMSGSRQKQPGMYIRLEAFKGDMEVQRKKVEEAIQNKFCGYYYETDGNDFFKIPGSPVVYWVSAKYLELFKKEQIGDYAISDGQTKTGDNNKYLRSIWEPSADKVGRGGKWAFHVKGGPFRRWYGNIDTLIDWSKEARQHYKEDRVARIPPEYIWFRRGVSWNLITSSEKFAVRLLRDTDTFNLAAPSVFFEDDEMTTYILGFMNTKVAEVGIRMLNPTLNTNIGDIMAQPLVYCGEEARTTINPIILHCVEISKHDWDSFETSWDFKKHPLI